MANPSLLILAGDGIGPEVMAEVKKIIGWMGARRGVRFDVSEDLVGGCAYDAHGTPPSRALATQSPWVSPGSWLRQRRARGFRVVPRFLPHDPPPFLGGMASRFLGRPHGRAP